MDKNGGFNIVQGEWGPYVNIPMQSVPTVLTMIVVTSVVRVVYCIKLCNNPGSAGVESPSICDNNFEGLNTLNARIECLLY